MKTASPAGSPQFRIKETTFSPETSIMERGSFTVRSVPRPYDVEWCGSRTPLESVTQLLIEKPRSCLLVDQKVFDLHLKGLIIEPSRLFLAEATEGFKTIQGALDVVEFLDRNNVTKADQLIVVGGGIIEDVGAFACAMFKRGTPWVYLPSTLLSQCDSCIGGKTGLNHKKTKNQLALFSAPTRVLLHPQFIHTLEHFDVLSGIGEVLKLHITGGPEYMDHYRKNVTRALRDKAPDAYKALILGALSIKKEIVEMDEFELDLRRSLNYGHTIGHAIESLSDYAIPHGLAVMIGVLLVNELSVTRGYLKKSEAQGIEAMTFDLLPSKVKTAMSQLPLNDLIDVLMKDKKVLGKTIHFVFIKSAGDTFFCPVPSSAELKDEIQSAIRARFPSL